MRKMASTGKRRTPNLIPKAPITYTCVPSVRPYIDHDRRGLPVVKLSRAELVALLEEVAAILESSSSAVEKVASLEELILEPSRSQEDEDADLDRDDEPDED